MRTKPHLNPLRRLSTCLSLITCWLLCSPTSAHASFLHGETLDTVADVLSWVVLVIAPIVGIGVFLLVHIMPEKIAENKKHPQTAAIQCLCLLSLVFGGLLWPLAWLWAYSKPVMYKLAYGTDVDESIGHGKKPAAEAAPSDDEAGRLRAQVAKLEAKLAAKNTKGGKA